MADVRRILNEKQKIIMRRRRQSQIRRMRVRSLLLFFILMLPLILTSGVKASQKPERIMIQVQEAYMYEGDEIPEFSVKVDYTGDKNKVIDNETKATLESLVVELENGNGYELISDVDGNVEGDYPIYIHMGQKWKKDLLYKWLGNVFIYPKEAVIHVKNSYGEWQGDKFINPEGKQVVNEFIQIREKTYYLDRDGKVTKGRMKIGLKTYVFDQEGVLVDQQVGIDKDKKMIAITLDDGPGQYTNQLLDVLEENNSHATFFLLGMNLGSKYEKELKRMVALGCELGNHTTNHARLTELSGSEVEEEINTTNQTVQNLVEEIPTVMRPPYGATDEFVGEHVGLPMVLWSMDTLDWKVKDAKRVADYMMSNVQDGDIVLLHDIHQTSVQALEIAIPKLLDEGYQLVTVSELANARNVKLKNGEKYSSFRP